MLRIPDTTQFTEETGWTPKYTFEKSLEFLLEFFPADGEKEKSNSLSNTH